MENPHAGPGKKSFVTFKVNQALMGIDILAVKEIHPTLDITPVQHSLDHIRGLMNLRGRIITVIDLGMQLGMPAGKVSVESCVVILKHSDLGLMVDEISDIVSADARDIEPVPANMGPDIMPFMDHVIHMPGRPLIILSVEKILRKING